MRPTVLLLALAVAFTRGSHADVIDATADVTRTTSSDVPYAVVTISNEQFGYGANIEGSGDYWQFNWSAYVGFDLNTSCSPDPDYNCSQYYAVQNGRDWQRIMHRGSVTYEWTVPVFAPGDGFLVGNPDIQPDDWTFVYDSGVAESVVRQRRCEYLSSEHHTARQALQRDHLHHTRWSNSSRCGIVFRIQNIQPSVNASGNTPEPSTCVMFGSGLIAASFYRRRQNRV